MNAKELGAQSAEGPQKETFLSPYGAVTSFVSHGLTKREAFAMAAMQGIMAQRVPHGHVNQSGYDTCRRGVALSAVAIADALLAELAKEQP